MGAKHVRERERDIVCVRNCKYTSKMRDNYKYIYINIHVWFTYANGIIESRYDLFLFTCKVLGRKRLYLKRCHSITGPGTGPFKWGLGSSKFLARSCRSYACIITVP